MFLIDQRTVENIIDRKINEHVERLYFKDISVEKLKEYRQELNTITTEHLNDITSNLEQKVVENMEGRIKTITRIVCGLQLLSVGYLVYTTFKLSSK